MRRHRLPYYVPPRGFGDSGRNPTGRHDESHLNKNRTLFVHNFHYSLRPKELKVPFETFGKVQRVSMIENVYSGKKAFVQFVDPCDALEARLYMNGRTVGGRKMSVIIISDRRKRPKNFDRARHGSFGHDSVELKPREKRRQKSKVFF